MKRSVLGRHLLCLIVLTLLGSLLLAPAAFGAVARTEDTQVGPITYTPPVVPYSAAPPDYTTNWMNYTLGADSGGTYTYTRVAGATANFTFYGTGVDWRSVKAANCGIAQVWVDGETPVLVNLYSSTTQRQQLIWSRLGLTEGTHTLHIVNTGTSDPPAGPRNIGIDSFDVYTPSDIVASAGPNGSVSPAGTTRIDHGGSVSYTIAANPGYHIEDVVVDTVSQGPIASYGFSDVYTGHTISATFAADAPPPVVSTPASSPGAVALLAALGLGSAFVVRRRQA